MRILTASILFLCSFTFAFGQGEVVEKTLTHNGNQRDYSLYVPSTYSSATETPLVLNLHGFTSNGPEQMAITGMNFVAEQQGFIVAYPSAIAGDWSDEGPETVGDPAADYSLSFFDGLLDDIHAAYAIDASRVYSTGFSQGGFTSQMLASARPDTFAAIASVGGVRHRSEGFTEPVDALFPPFIPELPPRPFPLLHIHGTSDLIVPFEGGNTVLPGFEFIEFASAQGLVDSWVTRNGCDPVGTPTELPNTFADDDTTVTLFSYGNCDAYKTLGGSEIPADVSFYRVNDGGHAWPVDPALRPPFSEELALIFPINSDFNASSVIWEFFAQHQLAEPVPEPASSFLAVLALGILSWLRTKRRPRP